MITQEEKDKWLFALRSGEYQQAFGQLRKIRKIDVYNEVSFCCLGVLCNTIAPDKWDSNMGVWSGFHMGHTTTDHPFFRGEKLSRGQSKTLYHMNDCDRKSFEENVAVGDAKEISNYA